MRVTPQEISTHRVENKVYKAYKNTWSMQGYGLRIVLPL